MKRNLLFLFLLISAAVSAQTPQKYWVQFTDKGNNSYTLSNPSQYLSARSLQRRTVQGISIDSLDLPVSDTYVSAVAATGVTVHARSKWLNGVVIITADTSALNAINAMPFVQSAANIGQRNVNETPVEKWDETFDELDGSALRVGEITSSMLSYGPSYNQANMIGAVCLHNSGFRGEGMVIAVIDAGFRDVDVLPVFDSLHANGQILGTWDFVAGDTSVYEDNSHGMMVLSCMGGNMPDSIVGTAPKASYWLLRSEEAASEYIVEEYLWACAAEYADSAGADLINSSLGYTTFDNTTQNHNYATDMNGDVCPSTRAADFAASRGMVVLNSAGNSGSSSWYFIGAPADADSILAVGAVDASGAYASFSSHGPSADGDIKPDAAAQGAATVVADLGGGVMTGNGTSFASPVLCGAVACLWQAHPSKTNMDIVNSVRQAGSQYSNPDGNLGYGIPDLCAANLTLNNSPYTPSGKDEIISILQNPFHSDFSFSYYSSRDQYLLIRVTDVQGRIICEENLFAAGNSINQYKVGQMENAGSGVYFLTVVSKFESETQKVIKVTR